MPRAARTAEAARAGSAPTQAGAKMAALLLRRQQHAFWVGCVLVVCDGEVVLQRVGLQLIGSCQLTNVRTSQVGCFSKKRLKFNGADGPPARHDARGARRLGRQCLCTATARSEFQQSPSSRTRYDLRTDKVSQSHQTRYRSRRAYASNAAAAFYRDT